MGEIFVPVDSIAILQRSLDRALPFLTFVREVRSSCSRTSFTLCTFENSTKSSQISLHSDSFQNN